MRKNNVEIKARVPDLGEVRRRLVDAGARPVGRVRQRDVYFSVTGGRFKLRVQEGSLPKSYLVFYRRPDMKGPKTSRIFLTEVCDPDGLEEVLANALGVRGVVVKEREIYLWRGVQVHLDRVEDLGFFVEFERPYEEGEEEAAVREVRMLMGILGIRGEWLVEGSYSDLKGL